MKRRLAVILCATALGLSLCVAGAGAEKPTEGIGQWLSQVGVFTGYIEGDVKYLDDLQAVPVGMRFGFDLKPFTRKFNFDPKGMLEIIYEPYIAGILTPEQNAEFGLPFFFRYSFPLTEKFHPYLEVGTGPYYMTLGTYEQSTQFNFVSAGGAGLTYFFREDWALSVGYRMRHVSNASIDKPNGGLEANVYTAGVSYYF